MSGTGEVLLEETWHYVYEEPQSLKKLTNNSSLLKYGLKKKLVENFEIEDSLDVFWSSSCRKML